MRREKAEARKRSAMDWIALKLEEHAEEVADAFVDAIRRGEWRAAEALLSRVYGKPTERVETVQDPLAEARGQAP